MADAAASLDPERFGDFFDAVEDDEEEEEEEDDDDVLEFDDEDESESESLLDELVSRFFSLIVLQKTMETAFFC